MSRETFRERDMVRPSPASRDTRHLMRSSTCYLRPLSSLREKGIVRPLGASRLHHCVEAYACGKDAARGACERTRQCGRSDELALFHDPGFAAPIGESYHADAKIRTVREELRRRAEIEILPPPPVSKSDLLSVHAPGLRFGGQTGSPRALAESQKFPVVAGLFPALL